MKCIDLMCGFFFFYYIKQEISTYRLYEYLYSNKNVKCFTTYSHLKFSIRSVFYEDFLLMPLQVTLWNNFIKQNLYYLKQVSFITNYLYVDFITDKIVKYTNHNKD